MTERLFAVKEQKEKVTFVQMLLLGNHVLFSY